jgi:hypothetical protein
MLKNILITLISFLLLALPMQAHTDVVIYNDTVENHLKIVNNLHNNDQHKNDSDDDKDIEHHHHCINIQLYNVFIPSVNQLNIIDYSSVKENFTFCQSFHYFSYLSKVFQPPKYS